MAELVIHVTDDDAVMRDSLDNLLDAASMTSRTYVSADEFLAQIDDLAPGCSA